MCSSTDRTPDAGPVKSPCSEDRKAGTIGLSGQMCSNLRRLITGWILLSSDSETGKILVELQDFVIDIWAETISDVNANNHIVVGEWLRDLDLGNAELVSINGTICRGLPLEQVHELLILLSGDFSIIFVKPDRDEWTKKVLILKPLTSFSSPLLDNDNDNHESSSSSFWADLPCTREPAEIDPLTMESPCDSNHVGTTTSSKELCLGQFPPSYPSWIHNSPMEAGDRILAVNDKPFIQELEPEDAQSSMTTMFHCSPSHILLLVWTPPSKRIIPASVKDWRSTLRRGVVAVSGGVMVGAGAILMVTPLHPIGHAMAIGGVGVLGTEFEAPRRVARRATSGITNAATNLRRSFNSRRASSLTCTTDKETIRTEESTSSEHTDSTGSNASLAVDLKSTIS